VTREELLASRPWQHCQEVLARCSGPPELKLA
jgi:hypothetical protein